MASQWTIFTNYGHVIFLIAKNPELTLREMAIDIGITERAVQRIISDLESEGFLKIGKVGRKNSYKIVGRKRLKHSIEKECCISDVVGLVKSH